jgi:hypothetical protein
MEGPLGRLQGGPCAIVDGGLATDGDPMSFGDNDVE